MNTETWQFVIENNLIAIMVIKHFDNILIYKTHEKKGKYFFTDHNWVLMTTAHYMLVIYWVGFSARTEEELYLEKVSEAEEGCHKKIKSKS